MPIDEKEPEVTDSSPELVTATQPPVSDNVNLEPYSIHGRKAKWFLVGMVALAGFFSPLPANIYFPAMPALATVFNVSIESVNLTVTIYLAMQGISPMLWGPLSDRLGRRPMFMICLAILVAACIGLALTPASAFWLFLLLRALQAGGCASTIALGSGVIGDISTPEERGGFFGMFNLGPMLAPCIGPVLGGALNDGLGWRSIFWFLTAFAAACLVFIACFLPETMRTLVGNGSFAPPHAIYRPLIPIIHQGTIDPTNSSHMTRATRQSVNPLKLFLYKDVLLTLSYTGIVYAVNYTITATISNSFAHIYPYLSDTSIGLCYLASGGGMILGSTLTGKMLDWEYRRIREKWDRTPQSTKSSDFPIEVARLRMVPVLLVIFVACVLAWGWCLKNKVSIAGPLVLQVILGYTSISILNTTMTLMIDIVPGRSSGVIACTNLVRCSLAAVLVSLIDKSEAHLGQGWTYVVLGLICFFLLPLIYIEMRLGPRWRSARQTNFSTM
ncbi:hypothetical protein A1O1_02192 [Capronia coronata CBS 617.96]|uniref:Citrate exporter 1 n=1 Tax=Capronia coronata CBS 617.96 TaxID=1182541 RepID=W9ZH19_9EURO|nr:uncharacterized protein A1O1_02192 [Capronia coronata CBS 617.96]EXJ93799.1 hypothetical protein A1O1_02192 [Capronia coronata CBS 617.96]